MVKIHPDNCSCRVCKKKQRKRKKEERRVIYGMFLFYGLVFLMISLI